MFFVEYELNVEDPIWELDPPSLFFYTLKEAEEKAELAYIAGFFKSYQIYSDEGLLCMERTVKNNRKVKVEYITVINDLNKSRDYNPSPV